MISQSQVPAVLKIDRSAPVQLEIDPVVGVALPSHSDCFCGRFFLLPREDRSYPQPALSSTEKAQELSFTS